MAESRDIPSATLMSMSVTQEVHGTEYPSVQKWEWRSIDWVLGGYVVEEGVCRKT